MDKELMGSLFAVSAMTTDPWIIIRSIMDGFFLSPYFLKQTSSSAHFTDSFLGQQLLWPQKNAAPNSFIVLLINDLISSVLLSP